MFDANAKLLQSTAATGTLTGTWYNTYAGTPFEGIPVEVEIYDASTASGTGTLTVTVQYSDDGQSSDGTLFTFPTVAFTGAGGLSTGVYDEIRRIVVPREYPWIRMVATLTGSPTTPVFSINAGFVMSDIP